MLHIPLSGSGVDIKLDSGTFCKKENNIINKNCSHKNATVIYTLVHYNITLRYFIRRYRISHFIVLPFNIDGNIIHRDFPL